MTESRSSSTSSVSLWIEEALSGWVVPAAALLVAAAAGGLYLAGAVAEGPASAAIVGAAAALAALLVLRPAFGRGALVPRALAAAAAVTTLVVTAGPAMSTVAPGTPAAEGDVGLVGESVPVPAGLSGHVRLLVHAPLPSSGMPSVAFRLAGAAEPIEGRLERSVSYARVGRGGRTAVAHDRSDTFLSAVLPPGTTALRLDRLSGELGGPLHVAIHRDPLPFPLALGLGVLALVLAGVADARLGGRNRSSATVAGMAIAFGLLVAGNATPAAAIGTTLGGIVLGAMAGAAAGALVEVVVRRLIPGPATTPAAAAPSKPRGKAAA